jgi:membrane protein YdbS with pleckstrin-like domain
VDIPRSLFDRMLGLSNIRIQTAADSGVHEGVIPGLDLEQANKIQQKILSHKK